MIIKVPEIFLDLNLTDRELVFAAFMYRIRKAHPSAKCYRMYSIDIKTIIGAHKMHKENKTLESFNGLIEADSVNADIWYIKCNWKRTGPVEVNIEDEEAIRVWCYLLGRTAGERYLDENNKAMQQFVVDRRKVFGSYGNLLDFTEFSQM